MAGRGKNLEIPPSGCGDDKDMTVGGGYLCSPPIEHGFTVYCDPSNHVPMPGGRVEPRAKGVQEVVVTR